VAKTVSRSIPGAAPLMSRREHWRAILDDWRQSGLRQTEFCQRRGIAPGTLAWWKHTFGREPGPAIPPAPGRPMAFVPVRIRPAPRPCLMAGRLGANDGELEIMLSGGRRVRVRGRVDPQWLGQVIAAVATGRC
jgi:hypothetical protein